MCPLLGSRVVLRRQRDRTLNGKHGEAVDYGYHDGDSNDVRWYVVVVLVVVRGDARGVGTW